MTSHGANSKPHVPEDGLPIGDTMQEGPPSAGWPICSQTLAGGSLAVRQRNQFVTKTGCEDMLPPNIGLKLK